MNRILVISDIEGQYDALVELLIAGHVSNANNHWIFGNGHLVLLGDMMDRGNQVVEIIRLICKLENEAKNSGGEVHFILGNHEVMNLSGDYRYVNPSYFARLGLLKPEYEMLLRPSSDVGHWLRSKNIIQKIGDILFVHFYERGNEGGE